MNTIFAAVTIFFLTILASHSVLIYWAVAEIQQDVHVIARSSR